MGLNLSVRVFSPDTDYTDDTRIRPSVEPLSMVAASRMKKIIILDLDLR